MKAVKGLTALVALGTACAGPAQTPTTSGSAADADAGSLTVPGGPVPGRCKLGELATNARSVNMATLIANPAPYVGKLIRTRGYFVLQRENIAVFEPLHRKDRVLVDVAGLPATSEQELLQCRLKLVDVVGEVGTVHARSGEQLHIRATALVGAEP